MLLLTSSWQSCTGNAAPRVVKMHGVMVVYMYKMGGFPEKLSPFGAGTSTSSRSSTISTMSILLGNRYSFWMGKCERE